MKKGLHPETRKVVFRDVVTNQTFLVDSLVETGDAVVWTDGNTYPLVNVEISSSSHPAFSGEQAVDVETPRGEAFRDKYLKRVSLH
ncbi:MAG: type B 50S ribosomal protein L31 [Bdellovibrionota bacterium]